MDHHAETPDHGLDPPSAPPCPPEVAVPSTPPPRRSVSRRALTGLAVLAGLVILASAAAVEVDVFAIAALLALLPLPLYVGLALWFDRFEPEPRDMLMMAFLWGASVAVVCSGLFNDLAKSVVGEWFGTVATGPVFEECIKAVILFRFYRKRPDEFDGVIDGLVYAAMVGLGFAFVENIDYYGRSLAKEGLEGLAVTFTLRGILGPFSHPLFTAMTGVSLGLARQTARPWIRRLAPIAGLGAAVALHALWNAGATLGCVFFVVYAVVMLPTLAAMIVIAVVAWKGEGRIIQTQLASEVERGILLADEHRRLCSVRGRLDGSVRAFARGGLDDWRARRGLHRAASELAFLRHRVARGLQPPDPELEAEYLAVLTPQHVTATPRRESDISFH
jgi:RsiW-degrading membrane proteinase PrsW (M82 family)